MSLSRRERRGLAKDMGLLSKKESYTEMMERFRRSKKAGDYLHTHHLQDVRNYQEDQKISKTEEKNSEEHQVNPFGFLGNGN